MTSDEPIIRVRGDFEKEWPNAERSATEVVINLGRAGETIGTMVGQIVRPFGVPSSTALIVMEILRRADQPMTPSEVAAQSFVGRPTLSGVLATLERRGLVARERDTHDRRSARLRLTDAGEAILSEALPHLHRGEAEWCSALTEPERETLVRLLAKLPSATKATGFQPS